jgi:hypothetical protein
MRQRGKPLDSSGLSPIATRPKSVELEVEGKVMPTIDFAQRLPDLFDGPGTACAYAVFKDSKDCKEDRRFVVGSGHRGSCCLEGLG